MRYSRFGGVREWIAAVAIVVGLAALPSLVTVVDRGLVWVFRFIFG